MASRHSLGKQWLAWLAVVLGLFKGPVRRLCTPPPIVLQAIRWWVQAVRLWLAPRRPPLAVTHPFSPSAIPYGLYPLSCILLE